MFSGCTVPPDSKETELGSSDQKASPSAGKNTEVVLVPCSRMEVRPYSYLRWCGYFRGPWVSFIMTDEFSMKVTNCRFFLNIVPIFFNLYVLPFLVIPCLVVAV